LLEGIFEKFCHHPATPVNQGLGTTRTAKKMTSGIRQQQQRELVATGARENGLKRQTVDQLEPVRTQIVQAQPVLTLPDTEASNRDMQPLLPASTMPDKARLQLPEQIDHDQRRFHIMAQPKFRSALLRPSDKQLRHTVNSG
jgi:hypothetical protein